MTLAETAALDHRHQERRAARLTGSTPPPASAVAGTR